MTDLATNQQRHRHYEVIGRPSFQTIFLLQKV
jgi:hypothetical protein